MRSLLPKNITIPVAFKAIRYRRRVQLWNRQASIVSDLTMLAYRHGWCCFSISVPVPVVPSAAVISGPDGSNHRIKVPGNFAWVESDPT